MFKPTAYEIVKGAGKTMWCVVCPKVGAMRFYSKRECEAWIAKAHKNEAKEAEYRAERAVFLKAARAEKAAERAARPARPVQLALF